jgi:tRNA modification GTPase
VAHQPNPRSRSEGESAPLTRAHATIAAVATPPGRGGIGVVRISGPDTRAIAETILGRVPLARHATLSPFRAAGGEAIDTGVALFFPAPHSYTGEDVLELQGHGGPIVMRELVARCVQAGARLAEPGEFTRRAFLNERLDLAQAESVADLIDAASAEAARSAARSLAGEFSSRIRALVERLIELRMQVEACIDFPEEEIDRADRRVQEATLANLSKDLADLRERARQGALLREGLVVVLIGRPNVGKSSLLNRLAGEDLAIVTAIPGTTRDYVRATVSVEGVPIHLIDTAGLRDTREEVERMGVERTWRAIEHAGAALYVTDDARETARGEEAIHLARLPERMPVAHVLNKIDLTGESAGFGGLEPRGPLLRISARTGAGMESVSQWLLATAGWTPDGEGVLMARERHLQALDQAATHLGQALEHQQAFEFMAEDLRTAQKALNSITGEFGADDLLGEIFARFCIGK